MYYSQTFIADVIRQAGNLLLGKKMCVAEYYGERHLGTYTGEIFSIEFIRDSGCDGDGSVRAMGRVVIKATADPRRPGELLSLSFNPDNLRKDIRDHERGADSDNYYVDNQGKFYRTLRYGSGSGSSITTIILPLPEAEPVKK